MKRYVTLEDISDGKLYSLDDMVKADCNGCEGCNACCMGMGESVILDAYDMHRLKLRTRRSFEDLMQDAIELHVVDGVILPNLSMKSGPQEKCFFLDEAGRCSIHEDRPGICRLFPLGRYYEENRFRYFLQTNECPKRRTKIKVSKWLDVPNPKKYEEFIDSWHNLLKIMEELYEKFSASGREDMAKKYNLMFLQIFYIMDFDAELDFNEQFKVKKATFLNSIEK